MVLYNQLEKVIFKLNITLLQYMLMNQFSVIRNYITEIVDSTQYVS